MDAQAHLLSLGWAGPGHPLHPSAYKQKGRSGLAFDPTAAKTTFSQKTYPSNGLIKPLLVSQKQGNLGVGRRAHEPQAGNEWWLKGFERALGDVGKSESERSSGTATPVTIPANSGKFGALYTFFVKGGEMEGTIEEMEKRGKKRKSDVLDEEKEFADVAAFIAVRDKDEKRSKRRVKESVEDQFKAVEAFMELRDGKPKRSRSERVELDEDLDSEEQVEVSRLPTEETKAERREKRRKKREEKDLQRASRLQPNGNQEKGEDPAARALRRAEKKRRKAEKAGD